jgi:6-phosphogluconolactonase (cycloisomerase 2 family)
MPGFPFEFSIGTCGRLALEVTVARWLVPRALAALAALALACDDAQAPQETAGDAGPPPSAFIYAGGGANLHAYRLDLRSGSLEFVAREPVGDDARIHELDAARRRVYVQTQVGSPLVIVSFGLGADGRLSAIADQALPYPVVEGMTQIGLHPTARWMLVSATNASPGLEDQLMPVDADGRLGAHRTIATEYYAFGWDVSGKYFYGLDGEAIFQFHFDATTGDLRPNDPPRSDGSSGRTVLSLRNHSGGKWIYSVEQGEVGAHGLNPDTGHLVSLGYLGNPVPAEAIYWTAIALAPDGRFLYALGYVEGSGVLLVDVFAIDQGGGTLSFVAREKGGASHQVLNRGLQQPLVLRDFVVVGGPANGNSLQDRPVLAVYRRDPIRGTLTPVGQPTALEPAVTSAVNFLFAAP